LLFDSLAVFHFAFFIFHSSSDAAGGIRTRMRVSA